MKLILGLGNIGKTYDDTYHNVGFLVADRVAKKLNTWFKTKECECDVAMTYIAGEKIIIAKPRTYMNASGLALKAFLGKYPELHLDRDVIVVYDDIDLAPGTIKIKEVGGAGSHNGMKSIMEVTNTRVFRKIRVGIGEKNENETMTEFVLKKIKPKSKVRQGICLAGDCIVAVLQGEKDYAAMMNEINSKF